jgi:DNA-binding NtrC family response regulator
MESFVLVVDDEENLLLLLYEILSKEGYHVKTTTNAYEALDFVDQRDVRVAILDIRMYPVDGIALLAEVKKRSPSTQVIMMTGFLTSETQKRCVKYGATGYFGKPLDIPKLKLAVRAMLLHRS